MSTAMSMRTVHDGTPTRMVMATSTIMPIPHDDAPLGVHSHSHHHSDGSEHSHAHVCMKASMSTNMGMNTITNTPSAAISTTAPARPAPMSRHEPGAHGADRAGHPVQEQRLRQCQPRLVRRARHLRAEPRFQPWFRQDHAALQDHRPAQDKVAIAVVEGDQQTTNDAERASAPPACRPYQINTGKGCTSTATWSATPCSACSRRTNRCS